MDAELSISDDSRGASPLKAARAAARSRARGLAAQQAHPGALPAALGGGAVPVQAIQALPYVMTVVLLAGFIGRARAPAALGTPYIKTR